MPKLSPARDGVKLFSGLTVLNRGKVRDSYGGLLVPQKRAIVATDGISAKDYVLNKLVRDKGAVLTAMTIRWLKYFEQFGIKHHMVAFGAGIDEFLPEHLRNDPDRQARTMIVDELKMIPVEFVVRGILTGSAVGSLQEEGHVCGQKFPAELDLQDGDPFPMTTFSPTTKSDDGHDENVPAEQVIAKYPEASFKTIMLYEIARDYAERREIIVPDSKLEWGMLNGRLVLGDEVFTPDSSRFWPKMAWLESRKPASGRKAPGSYDKDPVRAWLSAEISKWEKDHGEEMSPKNSAHVDAVHGFEMPDRIVRQTSQSYRYIQWLMTGQTLENFQRSVMGISVKNPAPREVAILCGSENDWPLIRSLVESYLHEMLRIRVHILSCHRNPKETIEFATKGCRTADAIVGVGSKALQLAGLVDAFVAAEKLDIPVFAVALGDPGSKSLKAAQLSQEEIPGTPVILDNKGNAFTGREGLEQVLDQIAFGELPPSKQRKAVHSKLNFWSNI